MRGRPRSAPPPRLVVARPPVFAPSGGPTSSRSCRSASLPALVLADPCTVFVVAAGERRSVIACPRGGAHARERQNRGRDHDPAQPSGSSGRAPEPGGDASQLAGRTERLPGRAGRVHQLARRAAGLAEDRACCSTSPTTWPTWPCEGPDALQAARRTWASTASRASRSTRPSSSCPCTPDGYVIGDVILFYLDEDSFNLVGRAPVLNWVTFHAETGGYDVKVELDQRSALRTRRPPQGLPLPGPGPQRHAGHRKAIGKTPPELKFFNMTRPDHRRQDRSGRCATAWPASPAGSCSAPGRTVEAVQSAGRRAGEEFGLRLVGGRAYSSNTLESGWVPSPLPGDLLRREPEGLPRVAAGETATRRSASHRRQLRTPTNIEDYYFTPWDLQLRRFVKFDHDFIGREALEKMAEDPHRKKVTLALDDEDVTRRHRLPVPQGPTAPSSSTSRRPCTPCTPSTRSAATASRSGVSTWVGYSSNEGKMLTLAVLDADTPIPARGDLGLGRGRRRLQKPTVERHVQMEIRAIVCPVPYVETVRTSYAAGRLADRAGRPPGRSGWAPVRAHAGERRAPPCLRRPASRVTRRRCERGGCASHPRRHPRHRPRSRRRSRRARPRSARRARGEGSSGIGSGRSAS